MKDKILIVDDSEMNRELLMEMLCERYDMEEADSAKNAIRILSDRGWEFSLVLLDIVMPDADGFAVLDYMRREQLLDHMAVIMISADDSAEYIHKAYQMGAFDYISRPFDYEVVLHRVANTMLLYQKQHGLEDTVAEQIYQQHKNSRLMVCILSHIVEFRNRESGRHVTNIGNITKILLERLSAQSDKYALSAMDIDLIVTASALHDIGKVSVPDDILNKPGRLTEEEFAIMKRHTLIGAQMLMNLPMADQEIDLVRTTYEICRWHHERFDGSGYPDGLIGDGIPLSAQVVSIADVYDALTSERCYKKAFSHETAMEMILNGECGQFNPDILEALTEERERIRIAVQPGSADWNDMRFVGRVREQMSRMGNCSSERSVSFLNLIYFEHDQLEFLTDISDSILFAYYAKNDILKFNRFGADRLGVDRVISAPADHAGLRELLGAEALRWMTGRTGEVADGDAPFETGIALTVNFVREARRLYGKAFRSDDPEHKLIGVVGKIV